MAPSNRTIELSGPSFDKSVDISLEFFPPVNVQGEKLLKGAIQKLAPLNPSFASVTFGAGGSNTSGTLRALDLVLNQKTIKTYAHLTCISLSRSKIRELVRRYEEMGVSGLIALRGDKPNIKGDLHCHHPQYENAKELVEGLRGFTDFDVAVSAYPEGHPESKGDIQDMEYLKQKVDAGANRIITQYFFDNDVFYQFLDRVRAANITVPVIPGILPITNYKKIRAFSQRCGSSIPKWLDAIFQDVHEEKTQFRLASSLASEQCSRMKTQGITAFHFYTLNQSELVRTICQNLGISVESVKVHEEMVA